MTPTNKEDLDKKFAEKKKRIDEIALEKERIEKEFNALVEKSKKVIIALEVTGEEDSSFTDEQNAAIAEARKVRELQKELIELQKKSLLEVGVFLEEHEFVPLDCICRELKRMFRGHIKPKFIDEFCPPEWKPKK